MQKLKKGYKERIQTPRHMHVGGVPVSPCMACQKSEVFQYRNGVSGVFVYFVLGGRSHYVVPSALNSGYSFRLSITGCIRQGSLEEPN